SRRAGCRDWRHHQRQRAAAFPRQRWQAAHIQTALVQPFLSGQGEIVMDDRTSVSNLTVSSSEQSAYRGGSPLRQRFPTIAYLREHARHHIPRFAFEYCDGGAGSDKGIARNWSALDAVELVPRYGVMPSLPKCEVELFGRRYAAPVGIAPMG